MLMLQRLMYVRRTGSGADLRSDSCETSGFGCRNGQASRGCSHRQTGGLPHSLGIAVSTRGLKRLPVVDAAGRLAGIISRTDALAVFDRPDKEIRIEITSQVIPALSEPSWYSAMVKNGVVTLEGTPETISIGHDILARVRHVPGVVAVRDLWVPKTRATWVDALRDTVG